MGNVYEALRRAEEDRMQRDAQELTDSEDIRWEGAIFERVTSIERQLSSLEESLGKRVPEVEERLLHLLEGRLAALEGEVHRSMSSLGSELALEAERRHGDQRRLLLALAAVGLLVLLF
jgi:hypothetical protein